MTTSDRAPDEQTAEAAGEPPPDDDAPGGEPGLRHLATTALPAVALVMVGAVAATGAGLLMPGADVDGGRVVAARLLGVALVAGGWLALRTGWGRGTPVVGDRRTRALGAAGVIFAALAVLTAPHSDVDFTRRLDPSSTTTTPPPIPDITLPDPSNTSSTTAPVEQPVEDLRPDDSILAELLILLVIVALLAVALAGLLRAWGVHPTLRRGPAVPAPAPEGPPVDAESAEAGLAASLATVREGDDARAAIVAAYARLLDALADAGGPRRPEEAPHEHLHRVLGPLGVRPGPTHRLADLFVLARFSAHDVTAEHRRDAVASLEAVLDDLRRSPVAPVAPVATPAEP